MIWIYDWDFFLEKVGIVRVDIVIGRIFGEVIIRLIHYYC